MKGQTKKQVIIDITEHPKIYTELKKSAELAIAGNIIDYGVRNNLKVDEELKKIVEYANGHIGGGKKIIFHYDKFKKKLRRAGLLLYLADNAGETVFDRILIEEIRKMYPGLRIIYAVKEKPVINDALMKDAEESGICAAAEVISCGSDAPGTVLSLCSKEFLRIFREADMIISKGQGNFEVLDDVAAPIFFMFKVKCPIVARDVGCGIGSPVLLEGKSLKKKKR